MQETFKHTSPHAEPHYKNSFISFKDGFSVFNGFEVSDSEPELSDGQFVG